MSTKIFHITYNWRKKQFTSEISTCNSVEEAIEHFKQSFYACNQEYVEVVSAQEIVRKPNAMNSTKKAYAFVKSLGVRTTFFGSEYNSVWGLENTPHCVIVCQSNDTQFPNDISIVYHMPEGQGYNKPVKKYLIEADY